MDQAHNNAFFLSYIKQLVPEWIQLNAEDLEVQDTIGITNKTYIIVQKQYPTIQPQKIIFRHYGPQCEGTYIDRKREIYVVDQLAKANMAPKCYGEVDRVRIEQFLPNRILQQEQMSDPYHYRRVAAHLAVFQHLNIFIDPTTPLQSLFFQNDQKALHLIRDKLQSNHLFTQPEQTTLTNLLPYFSDQEINFLKQQFEPLANQTVFSHNDLLANNILLLPPNDQLVFIDFEYCAYNYRCFDIANYFAESPYDYTYPNPPYFAANSLQISPELVRDFIIIHTLSWYQAYDNQTLIDLTLEPQQLIDQLPPGELKDNVIERLNSMVAEFPINYMLSAFFWGGWAIHMAKSTETNFDYLEFAATKFKQYELAKQQYIQK